MSAENQPTSPCLVSRTLGEAVPAGDARSDVRGGEKALSRGGGTKLPAQGRPHRAPPSQSQPPAISAGTRFPREARHRAVRSSTDWALWSPGGGPRELS